MLCRSCRHRLSAIWNAAQSIALSTANSLSKPDLDVLLTQTYLLCKFWMSASLLALFTGGLNQYQVPNFFLTALYLSFSFLFSPSPFTILLHISVFLLRALHFSLCRTFHAARVEKKPSPWSTDSPAGDKEKAKRHSAVKVAEVFIPVERRRKGWEKN